MPRMSRWWMQAAVLLFAAAATTASRAENWPNWRGPGNRGISTETDLPVAWSSTRNVAWKLPLPGPAGSTPVIWDDRIFLTTSDRNDLLLMCIGTDGKERWRQAMGVGNRKVRGDEGNFASPSPSTDGRHVWAMMGNGEIGCFTRDGKPVWRFNLQDRYGKFRIQFGMTSTPVLDDGHLYVQLIHGDRDVRTKEALVVGLDASTGEELWKQPRDTGAYDENEHAYTSPVVYEDAERKFLLTHGADYIIAHDPTTGREIWRCGGLNPHDDPNRPYHRTLRMVASPGWAPGIIIAPTAKNGPVVALKPGYTGDLTDNDAAKYWTRPKDTPDVPSPLVHDGLVYLCRENGNLLCLEAATGKELYYERTHRNRHRASPVYADGHVYLSARDGRVTVVEAGREFKIVAENDLGESLASSPAISNGTIYLRTFDSLWAIRVK